MSEIQAILFNKKNFTYSQAHKWLYKNNFDPLKVHETENFFRFRLHNPNIYKRFTTKEINNGIEFVIGWK